MPAPTASKVATGTWVTPFTTVADARPLAWECALEPFELILTTMKTPTTSTTATTAATALSSLARRSLRACAARSAASLACVSSRRCRLVSRSATSEG